jgi:hypothetical protein
MSHGPPILAALATQPKRGHLLERALASLRPQVDSLHVFLNGFAAVPECVRALADEHVLSAENQGAERKLHWADGHDGIYLSCDDDFIYPQDYVETYVAAIARWDGRAIVTAHGRQYPERPANVGDILPGSVGIVHHRVKVGRWVNHGGTGAMGWDARRVHVPRDWPERNMADMQVSVWAQTAGVPIWLIPHRAGWIHSLAAVDPKGIYRTSQAEGHVRRNALLRRHSEEKGWSVFEATEN